MDPSSITQVTERSAQRKKRLSRPQVKEDQRKPDLILGKNQFAIPFKNQFPWIAVVLVAGLRAEHDKEVIYWQEIGETLKSKLEEDQKVPVQKLIRLWIAENFIEASITSKSLEMIAMDYLTDLIRSNLVMMAKINSLGEIKAVHIHDLIHEFSLVQAKKDNFLPRINELGIFPSSENHCKRVNVLAPCQVLLGDKFSFGRNINTLRFLPSVNSPFVDYDLSKSRKHLRVLDFGSVKLCRTSIDALQYLIHLKYLELQLYLYFDHIPNSICNLKELETFIVTGICCQACNPKTIWGMISLRHLHINDLYIDLSENQLEDLDNLQTCSGMVIYPGGVGDLQYFMKRFPNLEKLSCQLYGSGTPSGNFFPAFETLSQLKSLKIGVSRAVVDPYGFEDFTYPSNLKKLTLVYLRLPWSKLSTIGRLSNLEVLKLEESSFIGRKWDVNDGEFPSLKVLKLKKLGFSEWTASDDSYPNLQKVMVHSCWSLEEIPECFGSNCTLQLIELRSCGDNVVNSALKVKEMQIEEMGNSEFKVIISK
uniref:Late blight resistance protein homolog R1B-16 n=1 Tax=Nicotiana tabacum TaxID=4097 RepID=A0A1S4C225_TOBAC|nr:PREDICTED: putative late blight resistance protein homolog R1B-16 [Nicotiana tabacum]